MELCHKEKKKSRPHLTRDERCKIEALLNAKHSESEIARILGRAKSTISDEIGRGTYKNKYTAEIAQKRAQKRKSNSRKQKKLADNKLQHFVIRKLKDGWSPEIIAYAWNQLDYELKISVTSIYNFINNSRIELKKYLPYAGRRYKKRYSSIKTLISKRVGIEERPKIINDRCRIGDLEVDTIVSARGGKACLAVAVDRKTRRVFIRKMKNKTALEMKRTILEISAEINIKSITYDNGTENIFHQEINEILGCTSYFCRPYCSQDKGQVENRNKAIRRFFPKKTNFDLISDEEIAIVEATINNRPMKRLGWKTPHDVMIEECS